MQGLKNIAAVRLVDVSVEELEAFTKKVTSAEGKAYLLRLLKPLAAYQGVCFRSSWPVPAENCASPYHCGSR